MSPSDRVDALEKLLARVKERRGQPRTRVVVDGDDESGEVSPEIVAEATRDAGGGELETVHLQELDVVEELAPDSRTESVIDTPPTEDEESPISERRPKSEMPAVEVTLEDLEREAEPAGPGDLPLDGPTMEQMGSTVDLPGGDEPHQPLELEHMLDEEVAASGVGDAGDLEAAIPQGDFAGGWDESLKAPMGAGDELRRLDESKAVYEVEYESSPPRRPPTAPPPPPPGEPQPDLSLSRPSVNAGVPVASMTGARPSGTTSFRDLLDASLRLGSG